jgi:hypothetical protein
MVSPGCRFYTRGFARNLHSVCDDRRHGIKQSCTATGNPATADYTASHIAESDADGDVRRQSLC